MWLVTAISAKLFHSYKWLNLFAIQIRLESKISSKTRLTFCTTGILLRRLEYDPQLTSVTHVLVDEVHERSEESDFLLLILRDLLKVRKDLTVILMSATLNADLFSKYFAGCPVIEIPGRTFPVENVFLEDAMEITNYVMEENGPFARKVKKGTFFAHFRLKVFFHLRGDFERSIRTISVK